ncbi:predicted protein [Uncinocarpus reesii 1704]|uniref:Aminoglycoside phosphotransferase domain-containing protein n=1 Tax=Uncinocarpus reesii (strain UAMH 1704) TaxID=336963 RepID=C4JHC7_UNCRE|nr:uncharacterized protein UREG_02700 [Uncinocarpus reesii 1704]EEP77851.1 predicted protein [Uncinocarpus reesii 1704]
MSRPSENWPGFTDLIPESDKYQRIQHILSSAKFEHLKRSAVDLRRRCQPQPNMPLDVDCGINLTQFATGFNNLVLELAFSDSVYWIARIPYQIIDDKTKTLLLSEIATMNIIRQRTNIPIPRIFGFEISTNPESFGYPYILMEYLGGRQLDNVLALSVPQPYHAKVAKQLANVLVELQNLTFDRIGRLWAGETADQSIEIIPMEWHHTPGPLGTSFEYFYNQRQKENREIMALHPNSPDRLTACWMLKTALAHSIIEERARGPFPLCHLDLHYGNLLFDDEFNLVAVIDWSHAQAAPIEQLSVTPEVNVFTSLSEEENRPIVEFKELVVGFMKEMENRHGKYGAKKEERSILDLGQQQGSMEQCLNFSRLSTYMASKSAELMYRQYMASINGSLWDGRRIAKVIYGEHVTWEQLRQVYGCMPLP